VYVLPTSIHFVGGVVNCINFVSLAEFRGSEFLYWMCNTFCHFYFTSVCYLLIFLWLSYIHIGILSTIYRWRLYPWRWSQWSRKQCIILYIGAWVLQTSPGALNGKNEFWVMTVGTIMTDKQQNLLWIIKHITLLIFQLLTCYTCCFATKSKFTHSAPHAIYQLKLQSSRHHIMVTIILIITDTQVTIFYMITILCDTLVMAKLSNWLCIASQSPYFYVCIQYYNYKSESIILKIIE